MSRAPTENEILIRKVMGENYLEIQPIKVVIEDDLSQTVSNVQVFLAEPEGARKDAPPAAVIKGSGLGLVGSLWCGYLERYATEYQSLQSLEMKSFVVKARLDTKKGQDGSDAVAEVILEIRNSEGRQFSFSHASRSMVSSTVSAVTASVEYFINAERAFITLFKSWQDAKARGRHDLVTRYTGEMSEVVKSTSYATVIEKIKSEIA